MNNYQNLLKEYIGFEEETLEKDSREVYSMAGQIKFYNDVMNYLEYGDIKVRDLEKIKSLKDLYYFYMESDDYIVGRFENTQNLIEAYKEIGGKLMDRLTEEYLKFKSSILALNKEEIFERAFKIVFYNEIYRYFKNTGACVDKDISIASLYNFYIKYESLNVNNIEDIAEFLNVYRKYVV